MPGLCGLVLFFARFGAPVVDSGSGGESRSARPANHLTFVVSGRIILQGNAQDMAKTAPRRKRMKRRVYDDDTDDDELDARHAYLDVHAPRTC